MGVGWYCFVSSVRTFFCLISLEDLAVLHLEDLGCLSAVRGSTNGDLLEIQMVEHSEAMLGSKYGLRNRGVAFSWEKPNQPLT